MKAGFEGVAAEKASLPPQPHDRVAAVRAALHAAKAEDKARERERVRDKHKAQKRKRKQGEADEPGEGEVQVMLGSAEADSAWLRSRPSSAASRHV